MQPSESLNYYKATTVSVFDGDSAHFNIDLGFGVILNNVLVNLAGINAPEVRGKERKAGAIAKGALSDFISNETVILHITRFGPERPAAVVFVEQSDGGLANVNELMVARGFAVKA